MKRGMWMAAAVAAGLAGVANASSVTYSGAALSTLDYVDNGGSAQYIAGTPDVAHLFTADSGTSATAGSPAVFVLAPMGTLSNFSASYVLSSSTGPAAVEPYWNIKATDGNPLDQINIISFGGSTLNGSSTIHAYNYNFSQAIGTWGMTLSALEAMSWNGNIIGDMSVNKAGLEIGEWDNGANVIAASADFSSITVPASSAVPLPASAWSGLVLLGGLGLLGGAKRLRRVEA